MIRILARLWSVSLILSIFSLSSNSQDTLNQLHNYGWASVIYTGVVASDTGYYVSAIVTNEKWQSAELFAFLNLNGEIEFYTEKFDTIIGRDAWGELLYDESTQTFISAGAFVFTIPNDTIDDVYIHRYNTDGEIIDSAAYASPYGGRQIRSSVQLDDGGYAFVMADSEVAGFINISVLCVDKNLNQRWFKYYDDPLRNIPHGIDQDKNGDIVVCASSYVHPDREKDVIEKNEILLIDTIEGNLLGRYSTSENDLRRGGGILAVDDGYIVGAGLGFIIKPNPNKYVIGFSSMVLKYDENFNVEWERSFITGEPSDYLLFKKIIPTSDGNYVATGPGDGYIQSLPVGLLAKFSPEGDSLWLRVYRAIERMTILSDPWAIEETSDSGFVMVGMSYGDEYPQQGWILKVDKYGCLVPGCHKVSTTEKPGQKPTVLLYPNPSSEVLYIFCKPREEIEMTIYNLQGQEMERFIAEGREITYTLRVDDYPPGVYFLRGRTTDGQQHSWKFVVE